MAQELKEQWMTIERALGERMIESALVIIRSWMNELGENNHYEDAHASLRRRYNEQFSYWLTSDAEKIDEELNRCTGEAYQLADAVYHDVRVKRGLSPDMHGFNPGSVQSVMNYFLHCVHFRPEDIEWLREQMMQADDRDATVVSLALSSLTLNLRECFSIDGMMLLIEGMNAESESVSNLCIAGLIKLLIQYDIRIDYFRMIQDAFVEAMAEMEDGKWTVTNVLCSLIEMTRKGLEGDRTKEITSIDDIPKALDELMSKTQLSEFESAFIQWYPASEKEFMNGLMQLLPDTWLYHVLADDAPDIDAVLACTLLENGFREVLWFHPEMAEKIFRTILRQKGKKKPIDYINYAHCLLMKGDRMMAFENYKQARSMCKNVKEFYGLFRPDRGELVDHGVPVEQIYLIEDQLLQN